MTNFKIFSAVVVKNEVDILESTILSALDWSDHIIIMDNGSDDGTLELIERLEQEHEQVIFWGVYGGPFKDSLRSIIYDDYSHISKPGDWWCRLDSDEHYIDNPRDFISQLKPYEDHIYSAHFDYVFTEEDVNNEKSDPSLSLVQPSEKLRYYRLGFSEVRFVKIKKDTIWPLRRDYPLYLFFSPFKRIRLKHFQFRSITQLELREKNRNPKKGTKEFKPHWGKKIVYPVDECILDNGKYTYDERKMRTRSKHKLSRRIKNFIFRIIMKFKLIRRYSGV